jgi:hypothetical protein
MADYRAAARRAAKRNGIDPNIFLRQIKQESGFNPTARSGAGAIGIAQIMPATARGWGVDPTDPIASLNAAAKHMGEYVKQYGSYRNALIAYNAGPGRVGKPLYGETANYIKTILSGGEPSSTPRSSTPRASATPSLGSDPTQAPVAQALLKLTTPERPQVQITAPSLPAFASGGRERPSIYQSPQTAAPRPQRLDVGAALEAITALQPQQQQQQQAAAQTPGAGGASPSRGNPPASGAGKFTISGPDPGRLKPHLTSFANKVADQLGMNLTGLDGSSHSRLTTNGNVSQHYTGNATDIFTINGKNLKQHQGLLLQAGRAALIAAGMPPAKARKAPFGLYNVGGHQIIFGTNSRALGGDHTDHLHISAR